MTSKCIATSASLLTFGASAEGHVLAALSGDIGLRSSADYYPRQQKRQLQNGEHDCRFDRHVRTKHKEHRGRLRRRFQSLIGNLPADALRLHS